MVYILSEQPHIRLTMMYLRKSSQNTPIDLWCLQTWPHTICMTTVYRPHQCWKQVSVKAKSLKIFHFIRHLNLSLRLFLRCCYATNCSFSYRCCCFVNAPVWFWILVTIQQYFIVRGLHSQLYNLSFTRPSFIQT